MLALGDTLGAGVLNSINNNFIGYGAAFPTIHRWLSIQGDPTLRLNPSRPPANLSLSHIGTNVTVSWTGRGAQYYVYRSASPAGPFTNLLTPTPLTVNTFTTTASATEINYMVRGAINYTTGLGSYTNLSVGTIGNIP